MHNGIVQFFTESMPHQQLAMTGIAGAEEINPLTP